MHAVSTAYKPVFRVVYNKLLKATKNLPDTLIEFSDFIDVKGMKAQGNQITKLQVKEIVLEGTIEGEEPWPEEVTVAPDIDETQDNSDTDDEGTITVEWDMNEDEDDGQGSLF